MNRLAVNDFRNGGHGPKTGGSTILVVAPGTELRAVERVRLTRGRARVSRQLLQLLPVIIAAAPALALRLTADGLLSMINGGQKQTLAVRTMARLAQTDSSGIMESTS